jgi:ribosomal protein L3 glutamine methyltransferase
LHGGVDGLDIVRRILAGAQDRLTPSGVLIVEVGNSEEALGGGGVFLLTAGQLAAIGGR